MVRLVLVTAIFCLSAVNAIRTSEAELADAALQAADNSKVFAATSITDGHEQIQNGQDVYDRLHAKIRDRMKEAAAKGSGSNLDGSIQRWWTYGSRNIYGCSATYINKECYDKMLQLLQVNKADADSLWNHFSKVNKQGADVLMKTEWEDRIHPAGMRPRRTQLVTEYFQILSDGQDVVPEEKFAAQMLDPIKKEMVPTTHPIYGIVTSYSDTGDVFDLNAFLRYYRTLSFLMNDDDGGDDYFELMFRNAWCFNGGSGMGQNTRNLRVLVTPTQGAAEIVTVEDECGLGATFDSVKAKLVKQGWKGETIDAITW